MINLDAQQQAAVRADEEWRTVAGYPDYAISSMGRVKRIKYCPHSRIADDGIMTPYKIGRYGYWAVRLFRDGKGKMLRVHRLVLEAFIGSCPDGFTGNHMNGNKDDNRVVNLEWVTQLENTRHAFSIGLHRRGKGDRGHNARLKRGEVWLIKKLLLGGVSQSVIAKMFRVSDTHITRIKQGVTWGDVQYDPIG